LRAARKSYRGRLYDPDVGLNPGDGIASWNWTITDPDGKTTTSQEAFFDYQPPVAGEYTVTLQVTDLDEGKTDTTSTTFTVDPQPRPHLAVSPDAVDFGAVPLGDQAEQSITVANTGPSDSVLHVSSVALASSSTSFSIISGGAQFDLAGGESHLIVVSFTPISTAPGQQDATLVVKADEPAQPSSASVDLTGTAVGFPPVALIDGPDEVDLGAPAIFQSLSYDPDNGEGTTPGAGIVNWQWTVTSPDGKVSSLSGPTINLDTTMAGAYEVALTVTDDEGMQASTVTTVQVNAPKIDVEPLAIDLGHVTWRDGRTAVITVRNDGDAPLEVSAVSLSPLLPGSDFSIIAGGAAFELQPGASQGHDIVVQFAPQPRVFGNNPPNGAEAENAEVLIKSNDPQNKVITVSLRGVAQEPEPMDFAAQAVPKEEQQLAERLYYIGQRRFREWLSAPDDGVSVHLTWISSTGVLQDLSQIVIREKLSWNGPNPYYYPPPFSNPSGGRPNPDTYNPATWKGAEKLIDVDNRLGYWNLGSQEASAYDYHGEYDFEKPLVKGVLVTWQQFQWSAPWLNNSQTWIDMGSPIPIVRTIAVDPSIGRYGAWTYSISALGVTRTRVLSELGPPLKRRGSQEPLQEMPGSARFLWPSPLASTRSPASDTLTSTHEQSAEIPRSETANEVRMNSDSFPIMSLLFPEPAPALRGRSDVAPPPAPPVLISGTTVGGVTPSLVIEGGGRILDNSANHEPETMATDPHDWSTVTEQWSALHHQTTRDAVPEFDYPVDLSEETVPFGRLNGGKKRVPLLQ
jgi:hypothetical protein